MTRRSGELVQWNNKGGYGFVRDETGQDYYVHISKVYSGRPRIGDKLDFDVSAGRKGRPSAVNVSVTELVAVPVPSLRSVVETRPTTISRNTLGLRTAAATMMTLLILLAIGNNHVPLWLGLFYVIMGAASALLYRFDKLYALTNRWRVSEMNLHVCDLSFGIIGGLCAQEVYRHKTVKPRFVATTWSIALFHTAILAALAFGWLKTLPF
jgi:uncharacterized membrane protein YsdA (DUF1294 family)/cold shock CspA family protein